MFSVSEEKKIPMTVTEEEENEDKLEKENEQEKKDDQDKEDDQEGVEQEKENEQKEDEQGVVTDHGNSRGGLHVYGRRPNHINTLCMSPKNTKILCATSSRLYLKSTTGMFEMMDVRIFNDKNNKK